MSSLRGFKAVAAVALVAAGAMLVISPAVASPTSAGDDPNCEISQPRLIVSRVLELNRVRASMEVAVERAEIELRAYKIRIERADIERELTHIRRASKIEAVKVLHAIEAGERNDDCWGLTRLHADSAPGRSSHPVVRGINKMVALAKLPGQGMMVAQKMFSSVSKLVPPVFGGAQ